MLAPLLPVPYGDRVSCASSHAHQAEAVTGGGGGSGGSSDGALGLPRASAATDTVYAGADPEGALHASMAKVRRNATSACVAATVLVCGVGTRRAFLSS